MDLAQMNRAYLPRWLNIGLYMMAEAAIVCTDIGQVSPFVFYLSLPAIRIELPEERQRGLNQQSPRSSARLLQSTSSTREFHCTVAVSCQPPIHSSSSCSTGQTGP